MELWEIVSERICSLCEERHITINKLATMCGRSTSTIHNIISGRSTDPQLETLVIIANAFNMTVSEFLDTPALNNYFPDDTPDEE